MDLLADLDARGLDPPHHRPRRARGPAGAGQRRDLHRLRSHGGLAARRPPRRPAVPAPLPARRSPAVPARRRAPPGMVGDPGGRSEERNLLDLDTLRHNVECIKRQLSSLLDFEPGPFQATLVNNADWTEGISLLEFLRDVGKYATVNQMMAKDSVRARLESEHGISFTEFSYSLLQANDFRHLYEHHDVRDAGRSFRSVGQHRRRRRPHPPPARRPGLRHHPSADHQVRRLQVRQVRRRCGLARSGAHVAVPVPPVLGADATTPWSAPT